MINLITVIYLCKVGNQMKDEELEKISIQSIKWVKDNLKFYRMGPSTIEVETPLIDAFGQKIYCFIIKDDEGYRITDDSWMLYKLDPMQEDDDFQEAAEDIVLGSGFDFDSETGEIFQDITYGELAFMINNLAQLEVALSFIK